MLELVSVHIPKTGGTSLRAVLERKYGADNVTPIYEDIGLTGRVGIRRRIWNMLRPYCVHGHFPASRFADTTALLVTFLRDPVEQRVATWHYVRRQAAKVGTVNLEWERALALDLPNFLASPSDIYARYLDTSLDRFAFIGSMARFDDDVCRLCDLLSIEYHPVRENANPEGFDYNIPEEWREAFAAANPREMEIYARASSRCFRTSCE